jgi:hypothetical protein
MKKILKWVINHPILEIQMPIGSVILAAQAQGDNVCVWAIVDVDQPETELRTFEVYPTGTAVHEDMGTERKYINTVQLEGGALVFHVFEYLGV